MSNLHEAHADIITAWQFYKKYATREPKDDAYYHDMAVEAGAVETWTAFGKYAVEAAVRAISEEDWKEKNR